MVSGSVTHYIAERAATAGFMATPDALELLADTAAKAMEQGTVQTEDEVHTAFSVWLDATILDATTTGSSEITASRLGSTWTYHFSPEPIDHPPHKCLQTSILGRLKEHRERLSRAFTAAGLPSTIDW
jgi:hypothetical protein